MKRKILIGLAAGVALAFAGTVYASGGSYSECGAEKEKRVRSKVERVLNRIEATPEQRQSIDSELDNVIASLMELKGDQREIRDSLRREWANDAPNGEALHALVDKKIDEIRAAAHEFVDSGIAVHGTLTLEQRDKIAEHFHSRKSRPYPSRKDRR